MKRGEGPRTILGSVDSAKNNGKTNGKRQRQTRLKPVSTGSTGLQGGGKAKGKVVVQTGDMTLITEGELKSIVRKWSSAKKEREIGGKVLYLIVGGTPCQDLSSANKTRKGVRKKRKEESGEGVI
jgi:hypothetical protein